jgi:protein SCO1/2
MTNYLSPIGTALLILSLSSLNTFAHAHHLNTPVATQAPSSQSLYNLDSVWQNQNGENVQLSSLRGKVVVLAMAYTSCQSSCPVIVDAMEKLEQQIKDPGAAQFVLASFDSKRDVPVQLKKYATQKKLKLDHWTLLHGDQKAVRNLSATLGIRYKEDSQGEFDHSNIISLLDKDGVIRFQQVGINKDSKELTQKLLELAKSRP